MNLFYYTILFVFGTLFGSFASVIIYRLRSGESWIWTGRSHCKTCERDLWALELVPIFSWLFQWGKCKGCKQKISSIYPILELTMWALFAIIWGRLTDIALLSSGNIFEWVKLGIYLSIVFFSVIYIFYDILYLEIPESILALAIASAGFWLILQSVFGVSVFPWMLTEQADRMSFLQIWTLWVVLWWLYIIMRAEMKEIWDILLLFLLWFLFLLAHGSIEFWLVAWMPQAYLHSPLMSGIWAALAFFSFLFFQIVVSKGLWMGGWDLRIGILMGLIVGIHFALPAMMIAYVLGSFIGVAIIYVGKIRHPESENAHQIPFWPFLASGYLSVMIFAPQIQEFIEWYLS